MDRTKTSKKALRSLINDSMRDAIGRLELPAPSKKVKKLLDRNAKKLATAYAAILKHEDRQRKKAEKSLVASIKGKTAKSKKSKVKAEALTV